MADESVRVTNTGSIGKAVANKLDRQLGGIRTSIDDLNREVKEELRDTRMAVERLESEVESLERRITEIEQTKARAQRQAVEDLKDDLEDQLEEKRQEFERRLGEVLSDYRSSIVRLKDRFLNSISGRHEQFQQVEDEFGTAQERRARCQEAAAEMADPAAANYEHRLDRVIDARNDFLETIDDFLGDRKETAATIDSLQTDVPGIDSATRIHVPFWVVGVRKGGGEELRVYPVQDRWRPQEEPTRAAPFVDRLATHELHGYGDMTDMVHEYVSRDAVRDSLADDEGPFADPAFLERDGVALDRFVRALDEYELAGRTVEPSRADGVSSEPAAEEVTAHD